MIKFLKIALISFCGFISVEAFAGKTLKLSPKESKQLTNNFMFTLNATCNIQGTKDGKIRVSILKNKGTVNGKKLNTGQATSVKVRNNQNISVSAEPGTKVNLINLGNDPVQAVCST